MEVLKSLKLEMKYSREQKQVKAFWKTGRYHTFTTALLLCLAFIVWFNVIIHAKVTFYLLKESEDEGSVK